MCQVTFPYYISNNKSNDGYKPSRFLHSCEEIKKKCPDYTSY